MAIRLTDILLKGLLSDIDPRMLLLQWGLSSLGFCSVSSDNFFVVRYTCLSLVLAIDFCYSHVFFVYILFKKDTKIKKNDEIFWKKMNSLKKGEGVPLLNFERGPGAPLLNFEEGPGVSPSNFRGVNGSHF